MKKQDGFPGQISYVIPDRIQKLIQQNSLISDLYLTDIGYYPNARHHYRERLKGVYEAIVLYNTSGKGAIRIDNNTFELHPDQYVIIPAGKPHAYYSDINDPWSIYWIHIAGSKVDQLNQFTEHPILLERGKLSRINARLDVFEEIFRNLERGFGMDTMEYVNMSLHYLLSSFTHVNQFRLINESIDKNPVAESINFMLENINRNFRLAELAKEVGFSASHYSRLFVQKTSHSPIDYFNQLKIQRACRLLDITNLSIGEIAREIGFVDPFYFSRIFKKVMGVSPRSYQKDYHT